MMLNITFDMLPSTLKKRQFFDEFFWFEVSRIENWVETRSKMKTAALKVFLLFVVIVAGQRIPNYSQAGKTFVQQYYTLFDSPQKTSVRDFYDDSVLVTGGEIFIGVDAIMQKYTFMLPVGQRNISTLDCQPTNDAGVIVNVFGRISFNDSSKIVSGNNNWLNSSIWFNEMFVLKPRVTSFFIQNQHFRSSVWNLTSNSVNNSDGLVFV